MADPWIKPDVENDFPFTPPAHMMQIADFAEYWGNYAKGTTAERSALLSIATEGQSFFDTDLDAWYIKVGSSWKVAYEDTGWTLVTSGFGNGFAGTFRYKRLDGVVYGIGDLTRAAGAPGSTPLAAITMPTGFRTPQRIRKISTSFGVDLANLVAVWAETTGVISVGGNGTGPYIFDFAYPV